MDFDKHISLWQKKIQNHLDQLVEIDDGSLHQELFEAARYSLLSPGKRLRPILTIATVESYGADPEKALHPACALEMIHTYSLIHDDLPCMDDDDIRRGKPTLHKVYTEGHALLTGDYLLTYAFQILSESPFLTSDQRLSLIRSLSLHAGSEGMIGGQVLDLKMEGRPIDWPTLESMHQRKTAALITSAIEFGGIIANVSANELDYLKSFGRYLGLAFQIVDDILDVTSTKEILGKPIGSDLDNEKATAITLLGIEKAKECSENLYTSAINALKQLSVPTPALAYLAKKLIFRDS